jgi:hypothetical protein
MAMTAGGPPGEPAERQAAEADTSSPADRVPVAAADGTAETAAQAGAGPAASDDVQQLEQEIERTRDQLGATAEQLAAKADVKARARAKAAEMVGRVKSSVMGTREQAAARAASVRGQVAGTTATARQKAISAGQAVAKRASTARQHPVPLAVAAGLLIAGYLALRQWRKR